MDEEGISNLPDPIFHHVLSFLSDKKAVQTCVVSKSWHHLVSTRPKFSLLECDFKGDKEKFRSVLGKSLQVYFDQKLSIEDFSVSCESTELVSLLEEWIPIVVHVLGANKFRLSGNWANLVKLPSAVFESESLEEINLESCKLSQINISNSVVGNNHNLKILHLQNVYIEEEEESFAKFLSRCSLIEDLSLRRCKGLKTINMQNHHNLKSFELHIREDDDFFLPSIVGHKYFPRLTCLRLNNVHLSNQWFKSFSCNFPCLVELGLWDCFGFDELKLSSRSIKNLTIRMDKNTNKATIDAPSIKTIYYIANISQSISFTATTSNCAWNSQLHLSLDQLDASLWFPKISELVAAFSQSQINSLVLRQSGRGNNQHIFEHLSDISVCCGGSCKMPVAIESLSLVLDGHYYDSFFSDLLSGLFRIIRPREMNQNWFVDAKHEYKWKKNAVCEFLCTTLQMGRWEQGDEEGVRSFFLATGS